MPEQIRTFGMSQMSVSDCGDFHNNVNTLIVQVTPAALHIETYASPYADASDTLDSIVKRQRAFITPAKLKAADQVRDNAVGTIMSVVNAYTNSPVEEHQEAASLLFPQLSPYKDIRRNKYTKETEEVRGMLSVLNNEKNTAAVTALGLDKEKEKLEEANAIFVEKFFEKVTEIGERTEQTDVKTDEAIDRANELYKSIVQTVNAYAIVQPSEPLLKFIKDVNSLITLYATSSGGSSSKPDTPDEPVKPEITKFYPKEGANPDRPLDFPRNKTAVLEGKGLKLVDSPEGKKAQLVLINYVDQRMPHEDSAILLNTDEKIEFTMMYDAAEGQYNFQIETYPNGTEEAVIIKYPETITLV